MNFLQKIKRRIKFITKESWNKNLLVILYSLSPSFLFHKQKGRLWIGNFLENKKFIQKNSKNKSFTFDNFHISYNDRFPIGDIISILLSKDNFIKRNFLNNSLIGIENPYEFDGVFLEKCDTVVDAGANIGLFSLFASRNIGKKGKVLAFEPIKEASQILNKNIKVNFITNIQVIPFALGDSNTTIKFYVNKDRLVSSSSEMRNEHTGIENVKQVTLDSFLENNPDIDAVDFIKVDIEGAERKFLEGAKKTIEKYKPKIAICTYHLPDDPEVIKQKIKLFVPEYKIHRTKTKLFAWIEK